MDGMSLAIIFMAGILIISAIVWLAVIPYFQRRKAAAEAHEVMENSRIRSRLWNYEFTIHVRTRDGKKTDMETSLINAFLQHRIRVIREAMEKEDCLELEAVYWNFLPDFSVRRHVLDLRVHGRKGRIMAAGHFCDTDESRLGRAVLLHLADSFKEDS